LALNWKDIAGPASNCHDPKAAKESDALLR
jgi:hypothetical protein